MSETSDSRGRAVAKVKPFLEELEAKPFWANLCEHKLTDYEWKQLSGRGIVYSFVNYHRAWHPSYEGKTPYNVSLVDLDEGPRLISNVIECPTEQVKIGMPVQVVFEDNEDYTLPKFRPA
ncbi:MAG: OB-fold domain-containing protein [Deltaproteobacteria bacterium]|nr:MAG: OB-fold domain-containing protein [Deltaproteobacteria bacterium]